VTAALAMHDFEHAPVLLREVRETIAAARPALIVDCTAGGAGHSSALLEALPEARLLALDRDPTAVQVASERLARFGSRARVVHAPFSAVPEVLGGERCGALLADLGVSSHQLDEAARGFSFRASGPLDMRMDTSSGESALELLARIDEGELASAIRDLGEERHARRVARAIVAARPIDTTERLANVVRSVVPRGRDRIDPATRTFQAIRMLVNDELGELERLLAALPDLVADDGVACVISFHSLEDRLVKNAFRELARGCICPPEIAVCVCGRTPLFEVLTKKPIVAADDEVAVNPRARSAKLRVARKSKANRQDAKYAKGANP
jgi:16S rRNA (cytosine1402-N4)-methyltransferase